MVEATKPITPERAASQAQFGPLAVAVSRFINSSEYFKKKHLYPGPGGQLVETEHTEGAYVLLSLGEAQTAIERGELRDQRVISLYNGPESATNGIELAHDVSLVQDFYGSLSYPIGWSNGSIEGDSRILVENGKVLTQGQLLPLDGPENVAALVDEGMQARGIQLRLGPNLYVNFGIDSFKRHEQATSVDLIVVPTPSARPEQVN